MGKKTWAVLISAAAVLIGIIIMFPDNKPEAEESGNVSVPAASAAERIDYFASHGWEVEEIAGKNITIPTEFSDAYEEYAMIQDKQGLPLRDYAGKNAKLYVYQVKNYSPESHNLLAELLVCDNTAVASLVYSEESGGLRLSVA